MRNSWKFIVLYFLLSAISQLAASNLLPSAASPAVSGQNVGSVSADGKKYDDKTTPTITVAIKETTMDTDKRFAESVKSKTERAGKADVDKLKNLKQRYGKSGPVSSKSEGQKQPPNSGQNLNEMLVPENSTTALICEPIFNENSVEKSATWYKDGRPVATVTGHTNAILDNRDIKFEGPIPQVGFLIITNIQIADQGDYWCVRDDETRHAGERSSLRVAFLHKFDAVGARVSYEVERDAQNNIVSLVFKCPAADALPKPTIYWFYEGEQVDFSSGRFRVEQNVLVVHRFSSADSGNYECHLFNFAGKTFANITLQMEGGKIVEVDAQSAKLSKPKRQTVQRNPPRSTKSMSFACIDYFRNEILWFLIGCLSTSCVVLLYLISGMLFFKCSKRGRRQRYHTTLPYSNATANTGPPSLWSWLRHGVDPNLIPGFRKVVAPAASCATLPTIARAVAAPGAAARHNREDGRQNLIDAHDNEYQKL